MIKDMISELKAQQACAVKMMDEVDKQIGIIHLECNKVLNEEWDKSFPGIECKFNGDLRGGSHAKNWQPSIFFSSIGGLLKTKYGWVVRNYEKPGLFKSELNIVSSPVDENKLEDYLNAMTDKLGIKVYFYLQEVSDQDRGFPHLDYEDDY